MANKTVVALGDLHCGAITGLTPPGYWYPEFGGGSVRDSRAKIQRACWDWFIKTIEEIGDIHLLIANGDLIDGKGHRSGGTEQTTSDLATQAQMAAECLKVTRAKNIICTYGTPYHVAADGEDFESLVADKLGCRIESHAFVRVNDTTFDIKHKVGSSSVPHGRHTAVAKEKLWNTIWADMQGQPKSQVILRSHVHYHAVSADPDFVAMTLPALQSYGSKYGERQCSGVVHYGLVAFQVDDNEGLPTWKAFTAKPKSKVMGGVDLWHI